MSTSFKTLVRDGVDDSLWGLMEMKRLKKMDVMWMRFVYKQNDGFNPRVRGCRGQPVTNDGPSSGCVGLIEVGHHRLTPP